MHDQHPQINNPMRTLKRGRGKRLSPEERKATQEAFLDAFKLSANITASCKKAGVDRATFYQWCEHDTQFTVLYHQAEEAANDMLLAAAWQRAVNGVERHVISMGRQVFEEIPLLNKDGTPQLDSKGKPMVKYGKPLIEREYSDTVLLRLMSWRIPGFSEKQQIEHSGSLELLNGARNALLSDLERLPDADQEQAQDTSA